MPGSSTIHLTSPRGWLLVCAVVGFAFLAATLVPVQTTTAQGVPAIDIQAATDGISVDFAATTARNVLTFSVRVVGPERFVFEQRVEDTVLQWIPPDDLADGFYHWEAWVVTADVGAQMRNLTPALEARTADHWFDEEFRQTHLATGSFKVENGLLTEYRPPVREGEDKGVNLPMRVASAILDFLVPSVRAAVEGPSNNFFGTGAGASIDEGEGNSFFGGSAGNQNTDGNSNSFFGLQAGQFNTTGSNNAFFGRAAGISNSTASGNSFFGASAGEENITGHSNSFFGRSAGFSNTTGFDNAFFGHEAGFNNTDSNNSFFGWRAGFSNTTGAHNAFFGRAAGSSNTEGGFNAYFGSNAALNNTTGTQNSFFGDFVGLNNTTGSQNSFLGSGAGFNNTIGSFNTFIGFHAAVNNTTGIDNSFFGRDAGLSNTTEDNNTFIGSRSNGAAGITNATALGYRAQVTQSNSLVLGSINGINGAAANVDVGIGISAPAAPLHVRRFDNTAQVRVEDTGSGSPQVMFQLINNGFPQFRLSDTSQGFNWDFRLSGSGDTERFTITKVGTGGAEMELRQNGNMIIAGTLTQSSSRSVKERIVELAPEEVLARLDELGLHEWSYQRSPEERHFGPMAEDFHAVFGLGGSNEYIAPGDLAGVALAAAKGLAELSTTLEERSEILEGRSATLEAETNALRAENAELRERLERLEAKFLSNM